MAVLNEMDLRSRHAMYPFVGMLINKSTGVVTLFDVTNENREPMISVLPKPVMDLIKYARNTEKNKKMFSKDRICDNKTLPPLNYCFVLMWLYHMVVPIATPPIMFPSVAGNKFRNRKLAHVKFAVLIPASDTSVAYSGTRIARMPAGT